jgi:capsular exopolysaccharide synthesis family protein
MSSPLVPEALPPPEPSLKEYLQILQRRKSIFLQVFVAVLILGVVATALARPVYQTHAKVLVPASSRSLNLVDSNNPIASMLAASQPDSLETQLQVLQSGPFQAEAQHLAGVNSRPRVVPPVVRVEALEGSNVLQITVEGGDPEEIARLANTVVDLHLKQTTLTETEGLSETREFVRAEREKAARELTEADRRLLAFQRDHRVIQLAADQEAQAKEYVTLQAEVHAAESNVATTAAQIRELQSRLAAAPLDLVEESARENPRRTRLEERRDELIVNRSELLQDFLPTSQRVRTLDERIARLSKQIAAEPEIVRARVHEPNPARPALRARLMELEATLEGHRAAYNTAAARFNARKGVIDSVGPWEVQHSRLKQERDAAQSAYNSFSDRLRDLEIRTRARFRTTRQIERAAVPSTPIRPKKTTNLMLAMLLALCLGAGAAFLQEHLDDRVNSPEDVERIAALPTLGHIPRIPAEQSRLVGSLSARSSIAEAYRALRSSIGFAMADTGQGESRRLMVTSASKGEGKSLTSVNLAMAMAQDGKRVVLVDADMRRPRLHALLDLPKAPGLSELLVGMRSLDETLLETEIENLQVICAGPIPPNPAELIGSHAFRALLRDLEARADVVILDTPPCIPVTDPLIVAARADGVLLVVQAGETRKEAVRHAVSLLARAHARILGVLMNNIQPNQGASPYYYHYYYYGYYGNGYGSEEAHELPSQRSRRATRNGRKPTLPAAGQAGRASAPTATIEGCEATGDRVLTAEGSRSDAPSRLDGGRFHAVSEGAGSPSAVTPEE